MRFEPAPANDFLAFMEAYSTRCRERVPGICAIAAKWAFEDLIPGLSDFDTRFILRDPMQIDDWQAMSIAVGEVHTEMARQFPRWHRNLEHLPGLNLTVEEILAPRLFYPEFKQWTFYEGDEAVVDAIRRRLRETTWSPRDELYHLKKVATYFGPYQRGIDPPVNLGPWENKYALHSRLMHYFAPPVHAMVCLHDRQTLPGKSQALRRAKAIFAEPQTIDLLFELVHAHYEAPAFYEEPGLTNLERRLERYVSRAWAQLAGRLTLLEPSPDETRTSLGEKVRSIAGDPLQGFFEGTRFCRLMEGRLRFYAADVPGFDGAWLIRNELGRIVPNFFDKPLRACGGLHLSAPDLPPEQVLERLRGGLLTDDEVAGMRRFVATARAAAEQEPGRERAYEVATTCGPMLRCLEIIGAELRRAVAPPRTITAAS